MALAAATAFFVRYALRAPMTSKLYKELGYSLFLGFITTYPYPYYYNQKYVDVIEECYEIVQDKFQHNPKFFNNEDQNASINKNFGLSQYNDNDIEDEIEVAINNT